MNEARPTPKFPGFLPPVRRVLALDSGSRRLKMLLAESDFGRLRILKEELVDLQAEGLVSAEEIKTHLHASLEAWGKPPLTLVIPEHLSISQVVGLPDAPEGELEQLIANESIKLSGATESRVVYDFVPIDSQVGTGRQFWVTLCQESNIRERIVKLGLEHEDLCDVTTTANALITAYREAAPLASRAILVHFGVQSTVVVILVGGQAAFAASFQMGGDFLTRAVARLKGCDDTQAEQLKRTTNLLAGSEALAGLAEVVAGWAAELKRQLNEWFHQHPEMAAEVKTFELVASGGGFAQPGLLEYVRNQAGLDLQPWPTPLEAGGIAPSGGFEAAFGAALQALGHSTASVSLLPEDYRLAWRKRVTLQRVELASVLLLCLCVLLLAVGTWRKLSLYTAKKALWDKVQAGQIAVDGNDSLSNDLVGEYEKLRPIVASQQNTVDTLKVLTLIQQSGHSNSWYVLIADQASYFSRPVAALSTNRPVKTNLLGPSLESLRPVPLVMRSAPAPGTNTAPARPGLIAELCVPGDANLSRQVLSEVVAGLKQQPMFSKVDLLSEDLRRNLADPKVLVPERHYALSLDFAETDFYQPIPPKKSAGRNPRRVRAPVESGENLGAATP